MRKFVSHYLILLCVFLLLAGCIPIERMYPDSPTFVEVEIEEQQPVQPDKGHVVSCSIIDGQAKFSTGWFPIENMDFEIYKGEMIHIPLRKKSQQETDFLQVRFDEQGQKMVFCPEINVKGGGQKIFCSSLYALDDDYSMGIKRTFDVPKMVRGSTMTCKYGNDLEKTE